MPPNESRGHSKVSRFFLSLRIKRLPRSDFKNSLAQGIGVSRVYLMTLFGADKKLSPQKSLEEIDHEAEFPTAGAALTPHGNADRGERIPPVPPAVNDDSTDEGASLRIGLWSNR